MTQTQMIFLTKQYFSIETLLINITTLPLSGAALLAQTHQIAP
jgi:hypothetical protein